MHLIAVEITSLRICAKMKDDITFVVRQIFQVCWLTIEQRSSSVPEIFCSVTNRQTWKILHTTNFMSTERYANKEDQVSERSLDDWLSQRILTCHHCHSAKNSGGANLFGGIFLYVCGGVLSTSTTWLFSINLYTETQNAS